MKLSILGLFFLFIGCGQTYAQTQPFYFSTSVKDYDTLSYDSSHRIFSDSLPHAYANTSDTVIPLGFDFDWYGITVTDINVYNSALLFNQCDFGASVDFNFQCRLVSRPIINKNFDPHVRYQTSGLSGKRIFTVEVKNAASLISWDDTLNFQYRIYEEDSHIEFQFGKIKVEDWSKLRLDTTAAFPPDNPMPKFSLSIFPDCKDSSWPWFGGSVQIYDSLGQYFYDLSIPANPKPNGKERFLTRKPELGRNFVFYQGDFSTGIQNNNIGKEVNVYPNPANQYAHIISPNESEIIDVALINIMGKKEKLQLYSGNKINIEPFAPGYYLLRVRTLDNVNTLKFLIR